MPTDRDLFAEEQQMATMSFGEHIEELRVRLILALIGLFVGVIVAFIPLPRPGLAGHEEHGGAGRRRPSSGSTATSTTRRPRPPRTPRTISPTLEAVIPAEAFVNALKQIAPKLELPPAEQLKGKTAHFPAPVHAGRR